MCEGHAHLHYLVRVLAKLTSGNVVTQQPIASPASLTHAIVVVTTFVGSCHLALGVHIADLTAEVVTVGLGTFLAMFQVLVADTVMFPDCV